MVKIERTNGENAKIAIASLEKEKQKKNGNYNASEIFDAINEIFHGKCYLCEQRGFYQVEHLIPHKGNKDLEFEWNNLFLACPHCNNIKETNTLRFWIAVKWMLIKKLRFESMDIGEQKNI